MGMHDVPSGPMDYLFIYSKDTNDYILINLDIFATVQSLKNEMNLINSCQAHLSAKCASNIEFIRKK